MSLTLMYITNKPDIAEIAENAGVDRIFIDLETIGKEERQHNMDTVKSFHCISDIGKVRTVLTKAELLVRVNKIYSGSENEINKVIEQGADVVMLPYFKTVDEVKNFLDIIAGRVKTTLLLETPEAVGLLDEILSLHGIDEVHIGLNDLHLGYHRKFMFELLSDGTVEKICSKLKLSNKKYGFGGIAALGCGALPAERLRRGQYRLGATMAILSRSFCNTEKITDCKEIQQIFEKGIADIRRFEKEVLGKKRHGEHEYFEQNECEIKRIVDEIVGER